MGVRDVAEAVGKGLFAGAIGTAAMTASSTLEMKLQNRAGSSAPRRRRRQGTRRQAGRRTNGGLIRQHRPLRIRYRLGQRPRSSGGRRTLRPRGHGGPFCNRVGQRAGNATSAGRGATHHRVGGEGDRRGHAPPRSICGRDGGRLLGVGPVRSANFD